MEMHNNKKSQLTWASMGKIGLWFVIDFDNFHLDYISRWHDQDKSIQLKQGQTVKTIKIQEHFSWNCSHDRDSGLKHFTSSSLDI